MYQIQPADLRTQMPMVDCFEQSFPVQLDKLSFFMSCLIYRILYSYNILTVFFFRLPQLAVAKNTRRHSIIGLFPDLPGLVKFIFTASVMLGFGIYLILTWKPIKGSQANWKPRSDAI